MIIGTLEVKCDHVENVSPIQTPQGVPTLRLLLDDVCVDTLMRQLSSMCDAEDLLEYIHDDLICKYLGKKDAQKLSPLEQYNSNLGNGNE